MAERIRSSDAIIALLTKRATAQVRREIEYALSLGKRVIPIVERGALTETLRRLMKRYSFIKRCSIVEPTRVALLSDRRISSQARIDKGEAEAIVQASERSVLEVLIDERKARQVAEGHSLRVCGLLGLLKEFAQNELIEEVGPLVAKLKNDLNYRIDGRLLTRVLTELGEL